LRAYSTGTRWGRRADCRRRAANFRAARTRAGRAFAAFLFSVLARVNNNRLLLWHRRFEHVLGEIWHRRALTLQHIVVHIGGHRAGRNTGLQDIFRQIWCRRARRRMILTGRWPAALIAGSRKSLCASLHATEHNIGNKESKKKWNYKRF